MFSSTRGNSFGIAKKVLCVIMTISLSLMMLPSTLFKTQANAAEVQDTTRVNAADLFKFSYAENSNSANKTTLTQADLLDVLNNRPVDITASMAQAAAENELKVQLDKANLFLEPGEALIAKEGAKFTDPSVESLALKDAATNNLNGHIYFAKDAQTKNFDVATSNVTESLSGAIDVAINYAQWDATYEVYFSTNSVAVPVSTDWTIVDATTAIIKYRFSQTGNAIDGKPTYNLETSIQVKNNTKNPTTFTAQIIKSESININNEVLNNPSNNQYIREEPLIIDGQHYLHEHLVLEYKDIFKEWNVGDTGFIDSVTCYTDSDISGDVSVDERVEVKFNKITTEPVTNGKLRLSGKYNGNPFTVDDLLIQTTNPVKYWINFDVGQYLANNGANPLEMRTAEKNSEIIQSKLCGIENKVRVYEDPDLYFYYDDKTTPIFEYDEYSSEIKPVILNDSSKYKIVDANEEVVSSEQYELTLSNRQITISEPELSATFDVYDDGSKVDAGGWCKSPDATKISIKSEGSTVSKLGNAGDFSESLSLFVGTPDIPETDSGDAGTYFCLNSETGVVTKNVVLYKYDKTAPQYTIYEVADAVSPDTSTGNWFQDILNGVKFLFSKNAIKVKFYVSDTMSKFDDNHAVYLDTQAETNVKLTPNTEQTCWEYIVQNENPNDAFDFDINDWKISAVDVAGNVMEKKSPVPAEPGELVTKVVGKTPGPSSVSYVWNEDDTEAVHDNPTDISGKKQTLDIKITDEYFKYSEQYFLTNKGDTEIDKNVVTIQPKIYTIEHPEGEVQDLVYKKLSDISNNIIHCDFAPIADSYVTYTVSAVPITDGLGRKASGDEGLATVTFGVLAIGPSIQNVVWTPDEKTPEANELAYYNVPRKATIDVIYFGTQEPNVLDNYIDLGLSASEGEVSCQWTKLSDPYKFKAEVTYASNNVNCEGICDLNIASQAKGGAEFDFDVTVKDGVSADKHFVQDFTPPTVQITWADAVAPSREKFELADGVFVDYYNQYRDSQKVANVKLTENYWDKDDEGRDHAYEHKFPQDTLNAIAEKFSDFYGKGYSIVWDEKASTPENVYKATISFDDNAHHEFSVNGDDLAGNPADVTANNTDRKFVLDSTHPTVEVSWDREANHNRYFENMVDGDVVTATITVTEDNFYGDFINIKYDFTNNGRTHTETKVVDTINDNWEHNEDKHTLKAEFVTFGDEGDYEFNIDGEDIATNDLVGPPESDITYVTIDKTNPTGWIIFDNNNVVNGKYYTGPRTATITIDERNFYDENYPPEITTTPQVIVGHDGSRGSFNQSGWSHSNNDTIHTMTVSFPVEGTYVVTVEGNDLAQKALSSLSSGEFVIDWTQPNINISGVSDHQAYGDAIQPVVTINDANMSPQTTCQVNNLGITKGNPFQTSPAASDAQYTYSYPNPERIPDNDGVYRINVNAYDMAGNASTQTLAWSVNRFGSTYVIDAETEKMMDGYVNNERLVDVKVTEINPSNIEQKHVEMTKGSFTNTLTEGQDYTASVSGGGDSWVQCEYVIAKSYFKEDSRYSINYYSKDAAGNENDNTQENRNPERNAKVNVQFMLDNAKPTCYYNNLGENLINKPNHDASVVFEDNSKEFEFAKVTIDGDETYVEGDKLKKDKDYEVGFTLSDSAAPHEIKVESTDKAGNKMETSHKSVVVSTNPFVLWFYNTPLFIGTLVVIALIAGGLIYYFVRRGKTADKKAGK